MNGKKSFIAYVDWGDTFDALPDEQAGQLIKHLFAYVNDKNPVTDDILINAVFTNIKLQLKRDLKKWESTSSQRSEIGRLGGIKSGEARQSKAKQTKQLVKSRSKTKQNEHDTVTVNDTVNDNRRRKTFVIPVIEEVKTYFTDNGYTEDAGVKAFNYYNIADWYDSKGNKILNWKQKMQAVWFKDENKINKSEPKIKISYTTIPDNVR